MRKGFAWFFVISFTALIIVVSGFEEGWWSGSTDDDTTIPTITTQDANDLVSRLAVAEAAHGICYGWEISDGSEVVSYGSSRGAGVAAKTCPRYAVLTSVIRYTSASSEADDSAVVDVTLSPDLSGHWPDTQTLDRMGITSKALLEEPTSTTAYGALALPLLLAEEGVVAPLDPKVTTAEPTTQIGHPGSDFAASHRTAFILIAVFGGIALLSVIIGFVVRAKRTQEG